MRSENEILAQLKVDTNNRDALLNSGINNKKQIKILNKRINILLWVLN